jgi:hypothetical protein
MSRYRQLLQICICHIFLGLGLAHGQITPSADAYTDAAAPAKNFGGQSTLIVSSASQTRWGHSAVYDAVNNRMVIFAGGSGGQGWFPEFNDLWALSNANGIGGKSAWIRLHPAGTVPGRRGGHSAVYDPLTNRMLMFAGDSSEAKFYAVWTLTDANGL